MWNCFQVFGIVFIALNVPSDAFILAVSDSPRNVVHQIFVSNGGPNGAWGDKQFCPNGTFANGYSLKIEGDQGDGDDTMLNGITLTCSGESHNGWVISSTQGPWGSEVSRATCPNNQYLVKFQMNVEPNQGFGDDTAVNDIRFLCRNYVGGNLTEIDSRPPTPHFGVWGIYSAHCPTNSAICGLSTKIEGEQDAGFIHRDDTALNDVVFFCCDN